MSFRKHLAKEMKNPEFKKLFEEDAYIHKGFKRTWSWA